MRLDAEGKVLHDAFINCVKEADFLRNGTAKGIMALSKEDSTTLWQAVMERMYIPSLNFYLVSEIILVHAPSRHWKSPPHPSPGITDISDQTIFPSTNPFHKSYSARKGLLSDTFP